jgi:hypothetical protein
MTSKTTTKATRKTITRTARKKSNRINRQRRLQKQLQILLLERHSRRCIICHHPEREAIEEEFVHWRAPWKLAEDFKLADYRTVYRHARAAGLLLQRRERLHSALDAFVESVDDVTFTGDTILRAMRAYSCIDSHGRWTEIPTQVQFSTFHDGQPPQSSSSSSNGGSNGASGLGSATLDVVPKYSNRASRSDATACAVSPAQAFNASDLADDLDDDPDDDPEDDPDDDPGDDPDDESEEDEDSVLEENVASSASAISSQTRSHSDSTACAALPAQSPAYCTSSKSISPSTTTASSKSTSRSDNTACAASSAQSLARGSSVASDVLDSDEPGDEPENGDDEPKYDPDHDPGDDNDQKNKSKADRLEETTTCAASPAQVLPRDVLRGQNPNDRSPSHRTDCAALPRSSMSSPAQPLAPQRPKPDSDGFIWHPRPGYPDQEISEPDAQGRVAYKIHITPAALQLPSRETDARRAAELIYRSVIKKYGNQ